MVVQNRLSKRIDTNTDTDGKRDFDEEVNKLLSSLHTKDLDKNAGVAQLVHQLICNQPVGGSTPLASSKFLKDLLIC